jgi:hypothetical protein
MNATTRHSLTQAALLSADTVQVKSANLTEHQHEVMNHAWPTDSDSPTAALSKVLAQGLTLTES